MSSTAPSPPTTRTKTEKPDRKTDPHGYARAHIGEKLGHLTSQFRQLETRLRQDYSSTLTDADREAIRTFLEVRAARIDGLLTRTTDSPSFSWNGQA
jgi:hypothetical protein